MPEVVALGVVCASEAAAGEAGQAGQTGEASANLEWEMVGSEQRAACLVKVSTTRYAAMYRQTLYTDRSSIQGAAAHTTHTCLPRSVRHARTR